MLSLTCKAAIRSVIFLASRFDSGTKSSITEIAGFTDTNEHTVAKLLQALVRDNLVNSTKGPSGGFYLTAEQLRKPVILIVESIDGRALFRECGLGLHKCSAKHPCPIHDEYKKSRDLLERLFTEKKIYQLCKPVNSGIAHLL